MTGLPRGLVAALVGLAVLLGVGLGVAALRRGEPLTGPPAPLRVAAEPPADRASAGPATVELSADARTHPSAGPVRDQLQVYFDAINARDYARWATAVSPERVEQQPEDQWRSDYASTRDGTIRIDRIDDLPGRRLLVRVRFTSTQDLAQAPPAVPAERVCWRTSLPMSGMPPRIERSGPSSTPIAC